MKKGIFFIFLLALIALFISCNKDKLFLNKFELSPTKPSKFISYNWSPIERRFFSIESGGGAFLQYRGINNSSFFYHPLVVSAYNKLANDNETSPFVEGIVNKSGFPIWSKSFVFLNKTTNENLVLLPMAIENQNKLNGFIALSQKTNGLEGEYIINGISRQSLLDTIYGNSWQKASYAELMIRYDQILYNTVDKNLKEAYCLHKSKALNSPPPTSGNPPTESELSPPPSGYCGEPNANCEWKNIEVCWDNGLQIHWYGGIHNIPPHLDHDHDGVINEYDSDFLGLGIYQPDFEDLVEDWWEQNYENEYGDYEDFWNDYNGSALNFDFDSFLDIWDNFIDFFEDFFDTDFHEDDLYYDGDEIGCPFDDPPILGGAGDRNEIECGWFYLLDCGLGPGPDLGWYDDWASVVPCPECPGFLEYQDQLRDRLYSHWQSNGGIDILEFFGLYNLSLPWNCDPYSPCFEDCIDEQWAENYFNSADDFDPISFPSAINQCFIEPASCTSCFYTVTLYVEQPVPGTREVYDYNGQNFGSGKNAGHTFLGIEQFDPSFHTFNPVKSLVFGYYPSPKPRGQELVAGIFRKENENTLFNVAVTYSITLSQFNSLKEFLSSTSNLYQVQYNNCSTILVSALEHIGFNIPQTKHTVFRFGEINVNPADLGEDLKLSHPGGTLTQSPTYLLPPLSICE